MRLARAAGPMVILSGLAPFVVARFLWHGTARGGVEGIGLSGKGCPLLEHTGVPCAGCGATRALYHFVHGDSSFLHYNWVWVVALLALIAYGVVLTWRNLRAAPLDGPWMRWTVARVRVEPWLAGICMLAFVAIPWTVAMLNVDSLR